MPYQKDENDHSDEQCADAKPRHFKILGRLRHRRDIGTVHRAAAVIACAVIEFIRAYAVLMLMSGITVVIVILGGAAHMVAAFLVGIAAVGEGRKAEGKQEQNAEQNTLQEDHP